MWDTLSDSTSDENRDSELGTRLTDASSKIKKTKATHGCCFTWERRRVIPRVNLHQRGQLLGSVRVPEVDPPAGAAEGGGGEQRPVGGEAAGGQEVQGLPGSSGQVPDEGVRAQTPETHHLRDRGGLVSTEGGGPQT